MSRHPSEDWFVVDVGRIMRLPERLRRLWPPEFMPESASPANRGAASAENRGVTAPGCRRAPSAVDGRAPDVDGVETVLLDGPPEQSARGLDVLSAWLTGFAAELNLSHSHITIVISSGVETAHLALCIGEDVCRAILSLGGEGLAEFAGFQLLRRIGLVDLAQIVDGLTELVAGECVLTLSSLSHSREAGMEFLHRVDGVWHRPVLERSGGGITVGAEVDAGEAAVRSLLAATVSRLWTAAIGGRV